jgi:tetraacyldisaccharide 4'-kinase
MEQYYRSVITGERIGAFPAILRGVFAAAAVPYGFAIDVRNSLFDNRVRKIHKLPVPVISVGNLTTGGTGKTPTVIMLVHLLAELGKRAAVLTRGYGAKPGETPDEVLVIQQQCPGTPVIVNPDRVAGGRQVLRDHAVDVLILDDGFQHRRIHRDLNIVLCDATEPLGVRGLIPRGSWRERPDALARANLIMLTRCEQVSEELSDLAAGLLSQWVSPRAILKQYTVCRGIFDRNDAAVELAAGAEPQVVAFAGIGNPANFLNTVRTVGLYVRTAVWFGDHHRYELPRDAETIAARTQGLPIDAWITTQKDIVKLRSANTPAPLWYLRIAAELPTAHREYCRWALEKLFEGRAEAGSGLQSKR